MISVKSRIDQITWQAQSGLANKKNPGVSVPGFSML